jgi:hypothetical protein
LCGGFKPCLDSVDLLYLLFDYFNKSSVNPYVRLIIFSAIYGHKLIKHLNGLFVFVGTLGCRRLRASEGYPGSEPMSSSRERRYVTMFLCTVD